MTDGSDDTATSRSPLILCPTCNVPVRESRLQTHLERAHGVDGSKGGMPQPHEMTACPYCGVMVRTSRLRRHIRNVHETLVATFLLPRIKPALSNMSTALAPAKKAMQRAKGNSEPPIGLQVLEGIKNNVRWSATFTEVCGTCKRRIVFLDIGDGKQKAFDIDRDKRILGTHSCEERSESIFAFQAGIVDSNRRRH